MYSHCVIISLNEKINENNIKNMNKLTLLLETSELNEHSNVVTSAEESKNQSIISIEL